MILMPLVGVTPIVTSAPLVRWRSVSPYSGMISSLVCFTVPDGAALRQLFYEPLDERRLARLMVADDGNDLHEHPYNVMYML